MLCSKKWSWLKAWAMQIARRGTKGDRGPARRLAVIMHGSWIDGTNSADVQAGARNCSGSVRGDEFESNSGKMSRTDGRGHRCRWPAVPTMSPTKLLLVLGIR